MTRANGKNSHKIEFRLGGENERYYQVLEKSASAQSGDTPNTIAKKLLIRALEFPTGDDIKADVNATATMTGEVLQEIRSLRDELNRYHFAVTALLEFFIVSSNPDASPDEVREMLVQLATPPEPSDDSQQW